MSQQGRQAPACCSVLLATGFVLVATSQMLAALALPDGVVDEAPRNRAGLVRCRAPVHYRLPPYLPPSVPMGLSTAGSGSVTSGGR